MKKLILVLAFLLCGCFPEEKEKDNYSSRKSLLPEEVSELISVCKKQPGFHSPIIVTREGEAKGVICVYRNQESRGFGLYRMDANLVKIKMAELQEQKNRDYFGEDK